MPPAPDPQPMSDGRLDRVTDQLAKSIGIMAHPHRSPGKVSVPRAERREAAQTQCPLAAPQQTYRFRDFRSPRAFLDCVQQPVHTFLCDVDVASLRLESEQRLLTHHSQNEIVSTSNWLFCTAYQFGADGGTRTLTTLPSQDFKSCVSTGSTTSAPTVLMQGQTLKRNRSAGKRIGVRFRCGLRLRMRVPALWVAYRIRRAPSSSAPRAHPACRWRASADTAGPIRPACQKRSRQNR